MSKRSDFIQKSIKAADGLSLGISMVVAVILGVALGLGLRKLTGLGALFWLGVFIGVAAAILNVYKAYKAQVASYEEFKDEVRYKKDKDDDDDLTRFES